MQCIKKPTDLTSLLSWKLGSRIRLKRRILFFYTEWYLHPHVRDNLDFVYLKIKSFGILTDVDEMARPAGALAEPSVTKPIPMILPASWPVHLAAGSPSLASSNTTLAVVVASGHAHLACNSYFYSVETRVYIHTHKLQTALPCPPNIPHQQASTLNVAPSCLLECWEVYTDIIAAHPDRVWSRPCRPAVKCPQQIKEDGKELGDCGFF